VSGDGRITLAQTPAIYSKIAVRVLGAPAV
jgi:hypothetical protein